MIGDGREIDTGRTLQYDLCIMGGGAAGITLAREFVDDHRSVVLIESGGLEPDPETQQLYTGFNEGIPYPLTRTRLRLFGGTTNHWTGMCRPLGESELAHRPWIVDAGWPIEYTDLAPYYPAAQTVCELGPYQYSQVYWRDKGLSLLDLSRSAVSNQLYQVSPPTRFGSKYRSLLRRADNITVLLNSNVVEIIPTENGRTVTRVLVRCLNRNEFYIEARVFVLAAGGIENARLLLASNTVVNTGLGNQHDNVGRYFMDHIRVFGMASIQARTDSVPPSYHEFTSTAGARLATVFGLTPEAERQHRVGGFYTGFYRVRKTNAAHSYRALRKALDHGEWPKDFLRHLDNVLSDPSEAAEEHRRMELEEQGYTDLYTTIDLIEQAPDRSSRVRLSDQTDELGMPRLIMHWKLGEMEKRTLYTAHKLLREALKARNIGSLESDATSPEFEWPRRFSGSAHHMGTTRMHTDPGLGVVDSNCGVFGVSNLFVAGSSVFTNAGTTNPTLTIVALALRLAAHVRRHDR